MADSSDPLPPEVEEGGPIKPFLEHLEDLRWMLLKSIAALLGGMLLAGAASQWIVEFLKFPLDLANKRISARAGLPIQVELTMLNVTDPFIIILQIAFFGGVIISLPFLLYFIMDFLVPALRERERKYLRPAFLVGGGLFLLGVWFCYRLILPSSLEISYELSVYLGGKPDWRFQSYIGFVLMLLVGMGISFELPVVLLLLVKLGVVDARTLRRGWRWAIMGILIFAAVITPTSDPVTLALFSIPLYLLYEISVWIAYWMEYRARRRAAAAEKLPPD